MKLVSSCFFLLFPAREEGQTFKDIWQMPVAAEAGGATAAEAAVQNPFGTARKTALAVEEEDLAAEMAAQAQGWAEE